MTYQILSKYPAPTFFPNNLHCGHVYMWNKLLLFFLARIKEKFPQAFDDICLYSEVSYLLAHCTFRLPSRRFIQELFQDVQFLQVSSSATKGWCYIVGFYPNCCMKKAGYEGNFPAPSEKQFPELLRLY